MKNKTDRGFQLAQIIENYIKGEINPIGFPDYFEKQQNAEILIATWWDEVTPILRIVISMEKLKERIFKLEFSPYVPMAWKNHGVYYVTAFTGNQMDVFLPTGPEQVIKFILAVTHALTPDQLNQKSLVPELII
jgi:hypothetical protein